MAKDIDIQSGRGRSEDEAGGRDICPHAYENCPGARNPDTFNNICSRDYLSVECYASNEIEEHPIINPQMVFERRARRGKYN